MCSHYDLPADRLIPFFWQATAIGLESRPQDPDQKQRAREFEVQIAPLFSKSISRVNVTRVVSG